MNDAIFYFLYNFSHKWVLVDQLIVFFAVYFPWIVLALAAGIIIFKYKSWREFVLVFLTAGAAWTLAHILKAIIQSSRPILESSAAQALFLADGYAFPSGHASLFFAIAISIFFLHKKAGYWFLLFAFLISLARVMALVHSPIDILGGFVLGALVAILTKLIYKKFAYSQNTV